MGAMEWDWCSWDSLHTNHPPPGFPRTREAGAPSGSCTGPGGALHLLHQPGQGQLGCSVVGDEGCWHSGCPVVAQASTADVVTALAGHRGQQASKSTSPDRWAGQLLGGPRIP